MGLLDKLKKTVKEQEEKQERENNGGSFETGSRWHNKVKDDNEFGDKQAEKEGSGGAPSTPREKKQRENFRP